MRTLADRIERRAVGGRVVHLTPDTARLAARALRALAAHPVRSQIVSIVCGLPRCPGRRDCYNCFGRANAIMRLYEGELSS